MGTLYVATNYAEPNSGTTGPTPAAVSATITTPKTMLQVATPSTQKIKVVEWGVSFDNTTVNTPARVELVETGAIAATVTSRTPSLWDDPLGPTSLCVGGSALTGFTATAEGTVTATRTFDSQMVPTSGQYIKQFPLGREPVIPVSRFLRIRAAAAAAVNIVCYIVWEE